MKPVPRNGTTAPRTTTQPALNPQYTTPGRSTFQPQPVQQGVAPQPVAQGMAPQPGPTMGQRAQHPMAQARQAPGLAQAGGMVARNNPMMAQQQIQDRFGPPPVDQRAAIASALMRRR